MSGGGISEESRLTRRRALQFIGAGSMVGLAGCNHGGSCELSISKEHIGGTVTHGGSTEFEITVCNEGDGDCDGAVTIIDALPSGVTYAADSGNGWSCTQSGGNVTCEHPNANGLGAGDCLPTLTLAVDIGGADEVGNEFENCARIEQGDSASDRIEDCVTVPVEPTEGRCDLSVTKRFRGDAMTEGSQATFVIEVCNEGDGDCTDPVGIVDGLPGGLTFASGSGTGWSVSESGGTVTGTHQNSGGLAPGDCLPVLELTVDVGSMDVTGDLVRNCVDLEGTDANADNNSDCVDVEVRPGEGRCDLAVTKSYPGDVITAGGSATFEIEVCNEGDGNCTDPVTIVDGLPGGLTFTSASGSGWSVSESGGTVTGTHQNSGGLAPGQCLPILELTVDVGTMDVTGDLVQNCVSLGSTDVNMDNNRDCVEVPVEIDDTPGECDLAVTKSYDGDAVTEGEPATFSIEVCNEGDGDCTDPVTVVDALPGGVTFDSVSGSGWTATESGGTVTATHQNSGGLAPGDCLPVLELTVDVGSMSDTGDRIRNCVFIEGTDSNTDNNRDCVDVPVLESDGDCDLSITKTHTGGDVVEAGQMTSFEILVCNEGDGDCTDEVTVTDDLPSGVTIQDGIGSGWSVSANGNSVTATHSNSGGLAPGDCLPVLTLEVQVGSMDETGDQIRNCASIEVDDADPDNNEDCVTVAVTQPTDGCDGLEITKTTAAQFNYGGQEAYEITVCNPNREGCDGRIRVTDTLPNGISFVSHSGSGWSVSESGGTVTATHPNTGGLAGGNCLPTLTLTVDVAPVDVFPGGSDAVQNCATLVVDGAIVDEDCVTHVITNE